MLDLGVIFKTLYETSLDLAQRISSVWDWLLTKQSFGFEFLAWKVGFSWTPIQLISGVGIITLIGFWVIKALIPAS